MNLYYITHARMPTEKAHGLTIAKSCESFANAGAQVTLVLPRRGNTLTATVYEAYSVSRTFALRFLPVLDLFQFAENRFTFLLQVFSFDIGVACYLLFKKRNDTIVYVREPWLLLLSFLGFRTVYECHHLFNRGRLAFWLMNRAYRIITISAALKETLVQAGFQPEHILVSPSGVDLSIFSIDLSQEDARKHCTLPSNIRVALYTGNFTTMGHDKGISDSIKALVYVSENIVFVAVGGGETDVARYMQEAKNAGVGDRVVLRGRAPQAVLAQYQKAADVLLMPFPDTPHYRNHMSPVKMFEYMASGVPIIATELPTIREVLNDKNALLVPPGNPEALARGIVSLLDEADRAHALAERAQKDVEAYSWHNRSKRILAFISR